MSEPTALEQAFVIASELGLHARPAGRFVTVAARFDAEVEVARDEEWVEATSVLSLLSLAASQGTALRVRARGPEANRALSILGRLLESRNDDEAERVAAEAESA